MDESDPRHAALLVLRTWRDTLHQQVKVLDEQIRDLEPDEPDRERAGTVVPINPHDPYAPQMPPPGVG